MRAREVSIYWGVVMNNSVSDEFRNEIMHRLRGVESEHDVRILYACESGSRAWGFASPDSDYDVRFIYARRQEWYLCFDVERKRDVIEYPIVDEIDCGGWDIRKAMHLFCRTNGALLEWLKSPIRYIEEGPFAQGMRVLEDRTVNRIALCYHYSHMARSNAREYLFKDQARLKKYFYVLRPLLAIRYVEAFNQPPPIEFSHLVEAVAPDEIRPAVARLLELKSRTTELGYGPQIFEINEFIANELERHGDSFTGQGRPDIQNSIEVRDSLNELFKEAIS